MSKFWLRLRSVSFGARNDYSESARRVVSSQAWPTAGEPDYAEEDHRLKEALFRAESAELGCEIAYRREPTQAEGDAHEWPRGEGECHVPMGNHHGHRCLCGIWVWGGPTVCRRCVDAEAVKIALEWKDEAGRLWREEADRVGAVKLLLEANGCDCDCNHDAESHDSDCERCLACRISGAIET